MNLTGLVLTTAAVIAGRHLAGKNTAALAAQAANNNTLQNELLLFASGNTKSLTAYQKLTNTNIGNLTTGLGALSTQIKQSQQVLTTLGTEIGTVQKNTNQNISTINAQLQNLSAQINSVSNNVNNSSGGGFFGLF